MIDHYRFESFVESLNDSLPKHLERLEIDNIESRIPIIRKSTQMLIRVILGMKKPKRILEIGTATGFSSLLMLDFLKDVKITTIEKDTKRAEEARNNFLKYDSEKNIELMVGEAVDVLEELKVSGESYDLIFMDAAKAQYINYYKIAKDLLVEEGILIADNILQEGRLLDARATVLRRERTIHKRLREYINIILEDEDFETAILETGDGMSVSVKKIRTLNNR